MIEHWVRLVCDTCENPYTDRPELANPNDTWPAGSMVREAIRDGWKVYRTTDVYYGKAWCPLCLES